MDDTKQQKYTRKKLKCLVHCRNKGQKFFLYIINTQQSIEGKTSDVYEMKSYERCLRE